MYAQTPQTDASYRAWALILMGVGVYGGLAFATWMASFTETVEEKSPALIAHGLAVWGLLLRIVVAVSFLLLPQVIDSVTPLVENGAAVQAAAAREAEFLPTVQANQEFLNDVSARFPDGNVPADVAKQVVETVGADVATRLQTRGGQGRLRAPRLGRRGGPAGAAGVARAVAALVPHLPARPGPLHPGGLPAPGPWSASKAREEAEHDRISASSQRRAGARHGMGQQPEPRLAPPLQAGGRGRGRSRRDADRGARHEPRRAGATTGPTRARARPATPARRRSSSTSPAADQLADPVAERAVVLDVGRRRRASSTSTYGVRSK